MLLPFTLFCFLACAWRWTYDLEWTSFFLVANGIFTHWQVWFVAGTVLHVVTIQLSHYAAAEAPPNQTSDAVAHTEFL